MKVIEIGCTTIGDIDGIGKHARIVKEEFSKRADVEKAILVSGNTAGFSKLQYIFSMEMYNAFNKTIDIIKKEKIDCVIVEYPFSEYNPLIVFAYKRLKWCCHKMKCKLALSMHEYDRVNFLRRMVVRNFVKNADFVFVSEPFYIEKLREFNSRIYLRTIPNHIPLKEYPKTYSSVNEYVYFGLINKAKAFDKMIEAWDTFNQKQEKHLTILTATNIDFDEKKHTNIDVLIGCDDNTVAEYMRKAQFSIIPVIPNVGFNNSSFISTIQCGCIPIGTFRDDLKNLDFVINTESYELQDFLKALEKTTQLNMAEIESRSLSARLFGYKFTIESTVDMMQDAIREQLI